MNLDKNTISKTTTKNRPVFKYEVLSTYTYRDLFDQECINIKGRVVYRDGTFADKTTDMTLKEYCQDVMNLKLKYMRQATILNQINKYRAEYKKELIERTKRDFAQETGIPYEETK